MWREDKRRRIRSGGEEGGTGRWQAAGGAVELYGSDERWWLFASSHAWSLRVVYEGVECM